MPLDPVIAGGFRGVELQNPLEAYGRIAQLQQLQQQNQLAALKMDEYQRGLQEQNRLRTAIRPDFDPANPAHQAELYRAAPTLAAGVIEKAMLTRKTAGEIGKTQAETEKTRAETQDKQLRALGVGLANVLKDPSDAALTQTFDTLDATGVNTAPFRAQFAQIPDAEARRQIIMNYATSHPEGRAALEFVRPKPEKVDLKDRVTFIDMNPNSPTYGQETRPAQAVGASPGERLTAGTAAARLAFDKEKFAWEKANPGYELKDTPDGFVAVNKRDPSQVMPITLGGQPVGGGKPLTEAQGKATGFAMRAKEAHDVMATMAPSTVLVPLKQAAENVPVIGGLTGAAVNVATTKEAQKQEQAQREFVNAVMRQESGAAISQSEFDNARKQYFPQPGDSKVVIAQKAKNRETAIRSLEIAAGPGMKQAAKKSPAGANTPDIDALLNKYK